MRTDHADGDIGSPAASFAAGSSVVADVEAVALVAGDSDDGVGAVDVALILARFDDVDDAVGLLRQRRAPVGIVCRGHVTKQSQSQRAEPIFIHIMYYYLL